MAALLDEFAKGLCVGVDVLKQFVPGAAPSIEPAFEPADVGIAQCREPIRRGNNEAFAIVVKDDLRILARQPRFGFERDPVGRHVGGEQRMAGGESGLVPDIEQRDFVTQQQRGADFGRRD